MTGVYEEKETRLVTVNLCAALEVLNECESPEIEVWENDECLLVYGFRQCHAINQTKDVNLIKEDLLKQI